VGARLVPVRVDPRDPLSFARAVAFIARTPARIVAVPMWGPNKADWEPFRQAAERFAHILFVAAAGDEGRDLDKEPAYPAALGLGNMLVVTAGSAVTPASVEIAAAASWGAGTVDAVALAADSRAAVAVAAKAAAAMLARTPELGGAELKLELVKSALLQREGETPQRTRSLAVIAPVVVKMRSDRTPASPILDKARIPERVRQPDRREQMRDGKTR
jgi:hypothetical protein